MNKSHNAYCIITFFLVKVTIPFTDQTLSMQTYFNHTKHESNFKKKQLTEAWELLGYLMHVWQHLLRLGASFLIVNAAVPRLCIFFLLFKSRWYLAIRLENISRASVYCYKTITCKLGVSCYLCIHAYVYSQILEMTSLSSEIPKK